MSQFHIYLKRDINDDYAYYYTTIEVDSLEQAEQMAEDMYASIQSAKENYELEAEYDAKGDEMLDIKDIVDNSIEHPEIYPYCP